MFFFKFPNFIDWWFYDISSGMKDQSMNNTGEKQPDGKNHESTDNPGDILCNIEAENAAFKVRIKQEYDRACG